VSGNGGNLKFFWLAAKRRLIAPVRLSVIADRDCGALTFAREKKLEYREITYKRENPTAFNAALQTFSPDLIVTNWHKIIDGDIVRRYTGKLINLHYSLLPAFGGLIGTEPIQRAYAQGCKYIGPTCHLVDEHVDAGPILGQSLFTTNIDYEDAVALMFRRGCLLLLNSILGLTEQPKGTSLHVASDDLAFSPALKFDEKVFDRSFWHELADL
jgi:phosphoribosylglycinamide formyltransferase-1